jgi:nitroreductase
METLTAITKRVSIRDFSRQTISKEDIITIVDAGRQAPSARGISPWEFIVTQDHLRLAKIAQICENGRFIKRANCCIIVFCQDTKYYLEDGCAATENILLAATDLGIASCWVAGDKKPYTEQIKNMFGVPVSYKLVSMVALGYAKKSEQSTHKRRDLKEVLHWEHF